MPDGLYAALAGKEGLQSKAHGEVVTMITTLHSSVAEDVRHDGHRARFRNGILRYLCAAGRANATEPAAGAFRPPRRTGCLLILHRLGGRVEVSVRHP